MATAARYRLFAVGLFAVGATMQAVAMFALSSDGGLGVAVRSLGLAAQGLSIASLIASGLVDRRERLAANGLDDGEAE